jgi:hypothetical protein
MGSYTGPVPPITEEHPPGYRHQAPDELGQPVDRASAEARAAALAAEDERLYGPSATLTLSTAPPLVQLCEDVAVAPDAVTALVERKYQHDGNPRYSVDIHVAGSRAPIIVENRRLADVLEALRR